MVFEKVRDIIAKELDVDASKITMDTHIIDDLGADSLDAVELIMAIEDEFGIQVDDESAQKVKRISDLVYYIEEALK
ncbi:MAG TPA: acyl carrier protein [Bacilli bacterium]|jgi:acyl carrier protein|nr:acyl carrier protein [Acholeplasmataceae bacterium]OQB63647.1 MAG: Acyl carrier protein [Tenericutes bacterium ADurb.Bin140]HOE77468.1 acyl carrier protein [Bacilli bacterium]HON64230.1 acyl carrier protein [Bacilli bacterium]HOR96036.1 acyl carrier protein [Bacilli bacterium]